MVLLKQLSADYSEDRHIYEHANILGQWFNTLQMVKLCRLASSQPWLLVDCLSRGWWCCKGASLISQGSRSQLHSTNDLFNAWHSGAGFKESCQLCSCLWGMALVSDRLHHDSEHRVSQGAQTDILSHDSAIQIKVSSGWVSYKSLSFYVESFNMGVFFSLPWNFPICVPFLLTQGYPTQSTVLSQVLWALFPSILHSPSCCQGTLYDSLQHHTVPQSLPNAPLTT